MELVHRVGPWLLLCVGVFSLLQVTFFYSRIQKFWLWYFETQVAKRAASRGGMAQWHDQMSRRSVLSAKLRVLYIVWSTAMIADALAWMWYR
jgi:hypothetical protein